jgi:NTE family protein
MQAFQQTHEAGRAEPAPPQRRGTYWGIRTRIDAYGVANALTKDNDKTAALQNIRTRLNEFKPAEQGALINWGYALTDAAMRRWVDPQNAAPAKWPVAEFALG